MATAIDLDLSSDELKEHRSRSSLTYTNQARLRNERSCLLIFVLFILQQELFLLKCTKDTKAMTYLNVTEFNGESKTSILFDVNIKCKDVQNSVIK